jgi:hypothetical protein
MNAFEHTATLSATRTLPGALYAQINLHVSELVAYSLPQSNLPHSAHRLLQNMVSTLDPLLSVLTLRLARPSPLHEALMRCPQALHRKI